MGQAVDVTRRKVAGFNAHDAREMLVMPPSAPEGAPGPATNLN
jgi:hypothetical protein